MRTSFVLAVLVAGLLLLGCTSSKQNYVCPDSSIVGNPADCPNATQPENGKNSQTVPQPPPQKLTTEELVREYNLRFNKTNSDITTFASLGDEATQIINEYNSGHSYDTYKKYLEFGARYADFMRGAQERAAEFKSFVVSNEPELKPSLDTVKVLGQLEETKTSYKQLTNAIKTSLGSMSSDIDSRVGIKEPEKTQKEELARELAELANN